MHLELVEWDTELSPWSMIDEDGETLSTGLLRSRVFTGTVADHPTSELYMYLGQDGYFSGYINYDGWRASIHPEPPYPLLDRVHRGIAYVMWS